MKGCDFMKLSISIPKYLNDLLEIYKKKDNTTKSAVIQRAITMYLLLDKASPEMMLDSAKMLNEEPKEVKRFLDSKLDKNR